jgi:hypothetical protein
MEHGSSAQHASAVKAFYKNNDSLEAAGCLFCIHFNLQHGDPVPSPHEIKTWVYNFDETGSILKKMSPSGIKSTHTPESIAAIRTTLSPQHPAGQHALSVNISQYE